MRGIRQHDIMRRDHHPVMLASIGKAESLTVDTAAAEQGCCCTCWQTL